MLLQAARANMKMQLEKNTRRKRTIFTAAGIPCIGQEQDTRVLHSESQGFQNIHAAMARTFSTTIIQKTMR